MAIQEFIKKLAEQEDKDVVYSKPPKDSIKIIPPTEIEVEPKLNFIGLKKSLNPNSREVKKEIKPQKESKEITKEEQEELLFKASGTELKYRDVWFNTYYKAKESKKKNSVVYRIRQGKFLVGDGNQIILQPDYNTDGKEINEILQDKWLK